ncbi:MAG TPA: CRTAC1 family protein [Bryobacteraceae bacterium]|nr:CRTAC1 family protein [Bryobacteraceae bacterium]
MIRMAVLAALVLCACLWGVLLSGRPPKAAGRPHFVDVASRSKISYKTNNSSEGRKWFPQPMCGGVAIFDFDNDGRMDIFFTNGAHLPELKKTDPSFYNCLLRQRADGTFEDVTARAGLTGDHLDYNFGVAAGDYDNDGYEDLFIASAARNVLYHNNGNGTFTDVTEASGIGGKPANTLSVVAAWFDYDNDGLLDLIVSDYTFWSPKNDFRCTMDSKDYYCDPRRYPSVPPRLYRNLDGGKFADVTKKSGLAAAPGKGMGISIADFNNDGWPDIFIANDTEPNSLFINQKNGTFEEKGLELGVAYNESAHTGSSMGSDAKDFDNDGNVDIFYNNLMTQIWQLLRNRGDLFVFYSFPSKIQALSMPYSGWSNGFIDYNNDGWKDIYSANGDVDEVNENSPQHDTMFENVGGRTFVDVSEEMGGDFLRKGYQRGSAFGDLNNDGSVDIVVTSLNQSPRILRNTADSGNRWLVLDLVGHKSARDAIGAKVKLTTASGRRLHNHVAVSVGFMSSSDKRVHFGLGQETKISSLEIRWPSGMQQVLEDIPANQFLKIDEPRAK